MTVDHLALALARLPEQFKDKANVVALVTMFAAQVQDLETALQQLLLLRSVDTATGEALDDIGAKAGQARDGVTDDDLYRRYIRARITTNRSKGTVAELIKVAHLIVDNTAARIVVDSQGIGAVVVRVADVATAASVHNILITFLRVTAAGGVRVIAESSQVTPTTTFGFAASDGLGFATTGVTGSGGSFSSADD